MNFDPQPRPTDPWHLRLLRRPGFYLALSGTLVALEFGTGTWVQFPIAFVIPVVLASWFCAAPLGYHLAVAMPVVRLGLAYCWGRPIELDHALVNGAIRVAVLLFVAYLATQAGRLVREVRVLRGLLPVCAYCKKIRDQDERWQPIESYIAQRSEARFSHGICPGCSQVQMRKARRLVRRV
jgi:hypothetical protein